MHVSKQDTIRTVGTRDYPVAPKSCCIQPHGSDAIWAKNGVDLPRYSICAPNRAMQPTAGRHNGSGKSQGICLDANGLYSKSICAFSVVVSAKRTPTPMRRTGFPVRANASATNRTAKASWCVKWRHLIITPKQTCSKADRLLEGEYLVVGQFHF